MPRVLLVFAIFISVCNAHLWDEFKKKYSKIYLSEAEDQHRFSIFESNVFTIEEHNKKYHKGEVTYFLRINQFADLTPEEFKIKFLTYRKPDTNEIEHVQVFNLPEESIVPDSVDWREKYAVLDVKYQGLVCGSCWAFSALGAIEGQNAIKHNKRISLSEQELVDCSWSYGNFGCDSGNMIYAFSYMKDHGISTDENYPYKARDLKCQNDTVVRANVSVTGYKVVPSNEEALKNAVGTIGPISVAINGYQIMLYGGGIYDNPDCSPILDHAVLAVGYGTENGTDYWILKNSWSKLWGEKGYIRLARNKNRQCGISNDNSYPIIE